MGLRDDRQGVGDMPGRRYEAVFIRLAVRLAQIIQFAHNSAMVSISPRPFLMRLPDGWNLQQRCREIPRIERADLGGAGKSGNALKADRELFSFD
jgi:hypothetical protein